MTRITLEELAGSGERDFGASKWVTVDQAHIDLFADATGDHQWIHVDPEAAKAGPFGGTIAHGYLSLSLLPVLLSDVINVSRPDDGRELRHRPCAVHVAGAVRLRRARARQAHLGRAQGRRDPLQGRRPDRDQGPGEAGDGGRSAVPRVRRRARGGTADEGGERDGRSGSRRDLQGHAGELPAGQGGRRRRHDPVADHRRGRGEARTRSRSRTARSRGSRARWRARRSRSRRTASRSWR